MRDGDEWVVNGQKVWTSGGHIADMGMLVARTNPDAPKHQGITWFAFDMHQDGAVDVRPLREMTGRALFNEVFLSDARVPGRLGDRRHEQRLGGGQHDADVRAPGPQRRWAGQRRPRPRPAPSSATSPSGPVTSYGRGDRGAAGPGRWSPAREKLFVELARANGTISEPSVRQQLMKLHTLTEIARFTNLRTKAERAPGASCRAPATSASWR